MSSTTDKIKGHTNEVVGKAKRAAGEALDDPELKVEGDVQEAKGEAQKAVGKGKEALKDLIDKA
ncbi:CsbD family protein [Pleomorphomonas sp. JP5]|uniref:CsbD family protein n=1 Tax=Pleomorphomonas sp. JP5 TaxID=2942998 RepID=UPI002043741F|nr:CsbD family protein [Pleomorphomonas sp. JP5]MCM5557397.1 CsbD family protein [Pleomorphomonas sp. JP5]